MSGRLGLVIVAAGSSRRMGGIDKVWEELGGRPVLFHSLQSLGPYTDATVLVVREDCLDRARHETAGLTFSVDIVVGGRERQESVRNGLEALPDVDIVAVHDAARPFAKSQILMQGVALVETFPGAIPVIPLHDTVRKVADDGRALETVDRNSLRAIQTPQIFRRSALMAAHRLAEVEDHWGTDEAALVERAGHTVLTYPGAVENFKITTEFELRMARLLVGGAQ